jgi:hypothetical protein
MRNTFGEWGYGRITCGTRVLEPAGGQPGSSARARRSLALDRPYEIRVSLGVRLGATQAGGGSQPEVRHGLAVEVHMIDRRRKNPVRRVFGKIISVHCIF